MRYRVFIDESRHKQKTGYMAIGGVICDERSHDDLRVRVTEWRDSRRSRSGEYHWNSVRDRNLARHLEFVDFMFNQFGEGLLKFHGMTLDNATRDDATFSPEDPDTGLYKLHYQLCLHSFARYHLVDQADHLVITIDKQAGSTYDIAELERILGSGIRGLMPGILRPVHQVRPSDSRKSTLIQMSDILVGAISYRKNRDHVGVRAGLAKTLLSEHVLLRSGLPSFSVQTPYAARGFTIWDFVYGRERQRGPRLLPPSSGFPV